ncbi:urea amidolyase related protein [Hymenobacter roseosalivarius DSM 11622]|uniref:Urea amidolyase related protein n=1 Tax=Hymenobacter roseosalivarius DSM 11622 TaxID=645990 RepID=A0A1W1VY21_9BACT|nr:biotin-dependent carboxyltransferase family protein [Hymenobacter roseosalivarius]SMB98282.1 urea amidolyase related protein [Hymenobacter roseosalivarius DSM 11622]
MSLSILSPGLLTTVQDLGRIGYQKEGIIVSGAMDALALRVANLLVGNEEKTAGLELTLLGPKIRFEADHLIALTGAGLAPTINGQPVRMSRPIFVRAGGVLQFAPQGTGCRVYMAVAGGIGVPEVLGSSSTYLRAGMGGWQGRALLTGDVLPCPGPTEITREFWQTIASASSAKAWAQATWTPSPELYPALQTSPIIRAVRGPEYDLFSAPSQDAFWRQEFTVTLASDRMGYRLRGAGAALALAQPQEMLSCAVPFGTVQVPADGNPIILLADHQTTGGYPRIAQAITADFSPLAQVPPGGKIRFQEVSLAEAQRLFCQQELHIRQLRQVLRLKNV